MAELRQTIDHPRAAARLLARAREAAGYPMARDVAAAVGVSERTLRRYQSGRAYYSLEILGAIARVYGYRLVLTAEPIEDQGDV